ncbi:MULTISPECIES: acylneuraminate cytidylyltransferase family protein [unclassified Pseudodesulfovibrio]|uniref:acylneuraminate cytidylyltransferase family protein n=1 Tax=unclassified Pseudodesulfovibrio TaxID=2661612 RepID=UPI000FEB9B9A|nr:MULTISPECIES: acylneuraminate cytidylyltransferase family protein [unclassified Pseudodesulfovibrio]MCJ2164156.1 acylneuraminate cytidylyltransferase family protein [Pseudodesulfovibrio sp. S3-i]RWU05393.1 acylneuraminate cytidylyltransferase family protein [Pseudodesulfovibrio sp. S3]
MKRYGFIFARGGSKGVPGKNIKPLGGLPLIGHAIRAGQESGMLDRIIVSTDDTQIARIARDLGAEAPFKRPEELAQDTSPEWLAWQHAVDQMDVFDTFVSLPCTSPMRIGEDVKNCIELFELGDCDVVVTAREAERHPSFNMVTLDENGFAAIAMPPQKHISRRQDAPAVFDLTTVCYVTTPEFIRRHSGVFQGRVKAAIIPAERALDIDTELDFAFAEFMMERNK